jgi:hypothetical protein
VARANRTSDSDDPVVRVRWRRGRAMLNLLSPDGVMHSLAIFGGDLYWSTGQDDLSPSNFKINHLTL